MSLRDEQCRALQHTRAFIFEIINRPVKSWTSKELKRKARQCLKHYPFLAENGEPMFPHDMDSTTGWQCIKDEMPKGDCRWVLGYWGRMVPGLVYYDQEFKIWIDVFGEERNVTLWMYLPTLPKN